MRSINLKKGTVYGRLTVLGVVLIGGSRKWKCRCSCGTVKHCRAKDLTSGSVVSCGCRKRDWLVEMNTVHGDGGSPEYKAWENMRLRCRNKNTPYYKHYGARGIRVCKRWDRSYEAFLADMGRRPGRGYSLDRIDNDGDYEPGNCRWTTQRGQLRNTRCSRKITLEGVTRPLCEWSEISGVHRATIEYRIKMGWPVKQAVFEKARRKRPWVNPHHSAPQTEDGR